MKDKDESIIDYAKMYIGYNEQYHTLEKNKMLKKQYHKMIQMTQI